MHISYLPEMKHQEHQLWSTGDRLLYKVGIFTILSNTGFKIICNASCLLSAVEKTQFWQSLKKVFMNHPFLYMHVPVCTFSGKNTFL